MNFPEQLFKPKHKLGFTPCSPDCPAVTGQPFGSVKYCPMQQPERHHGLNASNVAGWGSDTRLKDIDGKNPYYDSDDYTDCCLNFQCCLPKLKIGEPVIMNAHDRPCSKLVAIVTDIGDKYIVGIYLSQETSIPTAMSRAEGVTKLEDFGAVLKFEGPHNSIFWAEQVEESIATYPETSKLRYWQESTPIKQKVRPEALVVYLRNLTATP